MFKKAIVLLMMSFCVASYAALDLELTQGVDGAVPIAIVPFGDESALGAKQITNVIQADLQTSGHFRVLPVNKLPEQPTHFTQVNLAKWRKLGVDNIVIGTVHQKPDGKFKIAYQLMNLYEQKTHQNTTSVLLNKNFTMGKNSVRVLAHHISDQIFEKLLGKKGVFSTHIAYVLVRDSNKKSPLYQMIVSDIDGHNQQALVTSIEPIMSPAWSPDGKRIAYVSFEGHKAAIYAQVVATGQRQKLADFKGINGAPAWSPDGRSLAVVLSKTGFPKIYTLNLDSRKLKQLTRGWAIDTEPSYTPDGQHIIFMSNRGGGPQIYQIPVQGGSIERLTFEGRYNSTASYTSDGKYLVMLHKESGKFHIALQDMTNGQLDILTDSGRNQSPSLAPNDDMVVFATRFGTKQVLGMVSRDAKIRIRIPAGEGDVREPAWSPV